MSQWEFQVGGTLAPSHASYIHRPADTHTLEALLTGELVYILDSRQKGKSSLIGRASDELRARGVQTVWLDLQRFGTNLTVDQWYGAMLRELTVSLGHRDEAVAYWRDNQDIGPMQRWFGLLEHVYLPRGETPLVIMVDEVDYVKALPFSTDEFFTGIREFYNRRAQNPALARLTFCLVGVSSPRALIADPQITPFNIGTRVSLTDFPRESLCSFEGVLGKRVVDDIFRWTQGHPYLTQLIARAVQKDSKRSVDAVVREHLLSPSNLQSEPNFADTERRVLAVELLGYDAAESRVRLLQTYQRVLAKENVEYRDDDPIAVELLLSGLVAIRGNRLVVRNRLYAELFNSAWITDHLPGAEVRRLAEAARRASRAAWTKAIGLGTILIGLCGALALLAAQKNAAALANRRLSEINSQQSYFYAMRLLPYEFKRQQMRTVTQLLAAQLESPYRGWELDHWSAVMNEGKLVGHLAFADGGTQHIWLEGDKLCRADNTGVWVGTERIGEVGTALRPWLKATRGRALALRLKRAHEIENLGVTGPVGVSLEGTLVASGIQSSTLTLRRAGGKQLWTTGTPGEIVGFRFSPDGQRLAVSFTNGVGMYAVSSGKLLWLAPEQPNDFVFDINRMVMTDTNDDAGIYDTTTGRMILRLDEEIGAVETSHPLRNGKQMLIGGRDGNLRLINVISGRVERMWRGHNDAIYQISIAEDETEFVSLDRAGEIRRWSMAAAGPTEESQLSSKEIPVQIQAPAADAIVFSDYAGRVTVAEAKTLRARFVVQTSWVNKRPLFKVRGSRVAVQMSDNRVEIRSLRTNAVEVTLWAPCSMTDLEWLNDEILVVVGSDRGIYRVRIREQRAEKVFTAKHRVTAFRCDPTGGDQCVVGDQNEQITLIREVSSAPELVPLTLKSLPDDPHEVKAFDFSPSGKLLAVALYRKLIAIFDLDSATEIRTLVGHTARPFHAKFSPDSSRVASYGFDNTVRIWNVNTGVLQGMLSASSYISQANWSPSGHRIVAGVADASVRVLEGQRASEVFRWDGHHKAAVTAQFSTDGKSIITTDSNGAVRRWNSR